MTPQATCVTAILTEHDEGLVSCRLPPFYSEIFMGRNDGSFMSVFPEQCVMQKTLSGIFADLMSDWINTQQEGGREEIKIDGDWN